MTSPKPRRFRVWIDVNVVGVDAHEEIVELPATATDDACNDACADCLETMISNELDTGWEEIDGDE